MGGDLSVLDRPRRATAAAGDDLPPLRDGSARAHQRREVRRASRIYSRFVTLMKVTLPLTALAMLALVAAWPTLTELPRPRIVADKGQLEMINPRFYAADEQNQPYSITATRADQSNEFPGLVALDKPEAEMTEAGGTWVTIRSDRGWYDRNSGMLRMVGSVHVLRDDGSEFTTDEAFSEVDKGTAWGDRPVVGQGPQGEINAAGFRMADRGKSVVFVNQSKANVASGPAPAPAPAKPASAPVEVAALPPDPGPLPPAVPAAPAPPPSAAPVLPPPVAVAVTAPPKAVAPPATPAATASVPVPPPPAVKPGSRPAPVQSGDRIVVVSGAAQRGTAPNVHLVSPPPVKPPVPAKGAKP